MGNGRVGVAVEAARVLELPTEGHGTGRTRARATNLGPAGGRRGLGSGAGGRCTWLAAGQRGVRGGGSRTPVTGISASLRNCPDGETKPR